MIWLRGIFSIYINIVMLCIGLYMAFVQSKNLIQVDHMDREGRFSRLLGWFYIFVGLFGFAITIF